MNTPGHRHKNTHTHESKWNMENGIEWQRGRKKSRTWKATRKVHTEWKQSVTRYTHDDNEYVLRHTTERNTSSHRAVAMVAKPDKWVRIRYTCAFCSRFFFLWLLLLLPPPSSSFIWRHSFARIRLPTRLAVAISTGLWKCLFFLFFPTRIAKKNEENAEREWEEKRIVQTKHISMWVRAVFS